MSKRFGYRVGCVFGEQVRMKIHNIRFGFATNSSSSHSIVIMPDTSNINDQIDEPGYFGWEHFTLKSKQQKSLYLAATLKNQLTNKIGKDYMEAIVYAWTKVSPKVIESLSIDHQSYLYFPKSYGTDCVDKDFFEVFKQYILNDNLLILGGNDNEESEHPLYSMGKPIDLHFMDDSHFVCRKDNKHWVLFNQNDGRKIRLSFDLNTIKPTKATAPELVDLKITSYCDKNCQFCYQDSNTKGKHADMEVIKDLIYSLSEAKIFEIALGGGEPTEHPNFVDILVLCRKLGVVPNFSTKSNKWLKDIGMFKAIQDNVGSFAYSVNSVQEAKDFYNVYNNIDDGYRDRLTFNYAIGTATNKEIKKLIDFCYEYGIRLTLLGFKRVGRGTTFAPYNNDNWLNMCKGTVGIDTVLAKEYESRLKQKGISDVLYDTEDGKFSMYIDAVKGLIGPSSYQQTEVLYNNDILSKTLLKYFKRY